MKLGAVVFLILFFSLRMANAQDGLMHQYLFDGNRKFAIGDAGVISINDPVPGWASVAGGTTGGGTDLSQAVTVSSMDELQNAVKGTDAKIVLVLPGTYSGILSPDANTTIIGKSPGVTIQGDIFISGEDKTNIIVRNMAVRQDKCNSYGKCRSGSDAVYIGNGAHHIWLDHMDVADGQDGNCDITKAGDYITISWSRFHYTYKKEHAFSNLIASSNVEFQSRGKLQITYMNCWWGDNVTGRQPMGRFGKIHMLNNYHKNNTANVHELNAEISLIAEHSYYDIPNKPIFRGRHSPIGWIGIGNEGTAKGMNESSGTVFEIPYDYTALTASEAKAAATNPNGGAGNTCTFFNPPTVAVAPRFNELKPQLSAIPVGGFIRIGGLAGSATVYVMDLKGRTRFRKNVSPNGVITLPKFAPGITITRVISTDGAAQR